VRDHTRDPRGYETAEEAVLAGFPPGEARVVEVRRNLATASVLVELASIGHPQWEVVEIRDDDLWYDA
jgi:hypothetical protein